MRVGGAAVVGASVTTFLVRPLYKWYVKCEIHCEIHILATLAAAVRDFYGDYEDDPGG